MRFIVNCFKCNYKQYWFSMLRPWTWTNSLSSFYRIYIKYENISRDAINIHKSVIFSREKQMRLVLLLSLNVHRVVSLESERYGEFTFYFIFILFVLIYFTILVLSRIQNAKCKKTKKQRENISNLFFLWFLSAVVIIHKCYQTYCEFRLKMHFVPINM